MFLRRAAEYENPVATRLRVRLVSVDVVISRGGVCGPRVMAPPFLLATQSCPVATLRTTPATGVWSISAASETAYWGWLYRKLTVPSMGSTIQVTAGDAGGGGALLPDHAIAGTELGEHGADDFFGRGVDNGHGVDVGGFGGGDGLEVFDGGTAFGDDLGRGGGDGDGGAGKFGVALFLRVLCEPSVRKLVSYW